MFSKVLLVALALAAVQAFDVGLKVKWGVPLVDKEYLVEIPRLESDVITEGWVEVARAEDSTLPSLKMYCEAEDVTFCALYDDLGYISGFQVAIPVDSFTDYSTDPADLGFKQWTLDGVTYWTNEQFFVSESYLNQSQTTRSSLDNTVTLRESAIWVHNVDGTLLKIGASEDEVLDVGYTKQNCIPTMGQHYFYNFTSEMSCDSMLPWFTLFKGEDFIGSGMVIAGKYSGPEDGETMWFEQPNSVAVKLIANHAAQCVYDIASDPGLLTMHVYYSTNPYTVFCLA